MDARSVWFRETGEGRPKEQLLIETMFCVYYLGKGIAARCVSHVRRALSASFPGSMCRTRRAPLANPLYRRGHRALVDK
jgi:hypothetical protein